MSVGKSDVLTRLDSLLREKSPPKEQPQQQQLGIKSILKSHKSPKRKNGGKISFSLELEQIIGFGGDMNQFHDEDDTEPDSGRRGGQPKPNPDEEMSVEELNVINLTKKNTDFNAKSINLSLPGEKGVLRLGAEKRANPPLVTVRPFASSTPASRSTPMTSMKVVNKVSPMINGEVVETKEIRKMNEEDDQEDVNNGVSVSDRVTSFSSLTIYPKQQQQQQQQQGVDDDQNGGHSSDNVVDANKEETRNEKGEFL